MPSYTGNEPHYFHFQYHNYFLNCSSMTHFTQDTWTTLTTLFHIIFINNSRYWAVIVENLQK